MVEDPENLSGLFWEWFLCHVSSQSNHDYNLKYCHRNMGRLDETTLLTRVRNHDFNRALFNGFYKQFSVRRRIRNACILMWY